MVGLLSVGGDVGLQLAFLTGIQVGDAAVALIRDRCARMLASVGLDPLQYQVQVHRITGLVADADRHLAVVALDPAIIDVEDVTVGLSEVPLGSVLDAGYIGGTQAASGRSGMDNIWLHSGPANEGSKVGSSLGLRIQRGLAEEVGLGDGMEVSPTAKDREPVLRPAVPSRLRLADIVAGVPPENSHASIDTGDAAEAAAF